MKRTIAVIDIGKSTTGLRIYSLKGLRLLEEAVRESREIRAGGLLADDIESALQFIKTSLKQRPERASRIGVIVPVTMGATIALVNEEGRPVHPVVSYQQKLSGNIHREFREFTGGERKIYRLTATPNLPDGLIIARQIFWLKERKKQIFSRAFRLRCLPQYIAGRFADIPSGKREKSVEYSYLGCHTGLYNFRARNWSYLAKKLGVVGTLFPARISYPWEQAGYVRPEIARRTGLSPGCPVLLGGHDTTLSNIPYALRERKSVVFSTGSWHIASHLGARFSLPGDGLEKDVLSYADIEGKPVIAARSALGFEFKYYNGKIRREFPGVKPPARVNVRLLREIISGRNCFVVPTLTSGSGQFPESRPRIVGKEKFFRDAETAYHALELSLVLQASVTIRAAGGGERDKIPIYLTGGAAADNLFAGILSTLFPEQKVIVTRITEGTSLGAAILGKAVLDGIHPLKTDSRLINYHARVVPKLSLDRNELKRYFDRFVGLCKEQGHIR